jgi:hypothetical protein
MNCGDGPRARPFEFARSEIHDHYIYIILLTGQRGEDNLIAGMEAGPTTIF